MKRHPIRISQCMIVKNEEKNIHQALSWGKGIVWEQIVVDTGSTDRTVELAEELGAKVYHFPWIDHFAAAKNFAISKASGDWIAFLDADEYLPEEWGAKLLPLLEQLEGSQYVAVRSPIVCIEDSEISMAGRHCRFFRRMPGLVYESPIHEYLVLDGKPLPEEHMMDVEGQFPIYHTGYTPAEMKEKKKYERNIRILKKELEKRPHDYTLMGYLGDSYNHEEGDKKEAELWYRKAIVLMPKTIDIMDERSTLTLLYFLVLLFEQQKEEEFLKAYEQISRQIPWVYDVELAAGRFYVRKKDYGNAVLHLEKALQIADQYGISAYGVFMTTDIAGVWEQLAWCHYENHNLAACVRYCVSLLKADNRRITSLTLLLKTLKKEKPQDIVRFLGNIYNMQQPEDRSFLLRGAVLAGAEGVLEILKASCTLEEQEYLEQLQKKKS